LIFLLRKPQTSKQEVSLGSHHETNVILEVKISNIIVEPPFEYFLPDANIEFRTSSITDHFNWGCLALDALQLDDKKWVQSHDFYVWSAFIQVLDIGSENRAHDSRVNHGFELIFLSVAFPPIQDTRPPGSCFADWIRMTIDPKVSRYHMQQFLLKMLFDKGIIARND
jgi:hypothetical protein